MSFHIVSHGQCYLSVNCSDDTPILLQKGDIILFPRDVSHCITNDIAFKQPINQIQSVDFSSGQNQDGTGLLCGYFAHNHPQMASMTQHLPEYVVIKQNLSARSSLELMLNALLEESVDPNKGSELVMSKMSEAILAILMRDHLPGDSGILAASIHPKLSKVIERIHEQPEYKWTVEQLAGIANSSRAGFAELFKDVVGQTPMEYVTLWRLSLAYRKLADKKVSTLHAALEAGYENESSFSKAFKRVMGVSPGAVRAG